MPFHKLFKQTLTLGIFLGFTTGSLTTANYYQRRAIEEKEAFLECQLAWEKYYSLTNQTNPIVQSLEPNQTFWQTLINGTLNIVQAKAQELITNANQPFNLQQQKYLVYQYEVLPKCSKLKDWFNLAKKTTR